MSGNKERKEWCIFTSDESVFLPRGIQWATIENRQPCADLNKIPVLPNRYMVTFRREQDIPPGHDIYLIGDAEWRTWRQTGAIPTETAA